MAEMITQCPKCSTAFHVTDAHLNSAKGSVRCGSCMLVFNGRAHLLSDFDTAEDEGLISDNSIEDGYPPEQSDAEHQLSSHSKFLANDKSNEEDDGHDLEEVSEDESWVLDLLEEEGHVPSQIGLVKKDFAQQEIIEPSKSNPTTNTSPTQSTKPPKVEPLPQQNTHSSKRQTAATPARKVDLSAPNPAKPRPSVSEPLGVSHQLMEAIETDAVEINYQGQKKFWTSKLGLALLTALGSMLLTAQIAWLKYSELNKKEPYRTYYGKVCHVIGCVLPELIDKSSIKTSDLLVRSHPNKEKALLVEVLVKNEASFMQPFPSLTLQFKDLKNLVVARRTFEPQDYLAGEVANMKMMPIRQPVRISMELVDPGEGAVSYDMKIQK